MTQEAFDAIISVLSYYHWIDARIVANAYLRLYGSLPTLEETQPYLARLCGAGKVVQFAGTDPVYPAYYWKVPDVH